MPFPDSQDPTSYGWPAHGQGQYEDYSYGGFTFPQGIAVGTKAIWDKVGDLITSNGTTLRPDPAPPLTVSNANSWNFWGGENRPNLNNPGAWSIHAWWLALDWNSADNPNHSTAPANTPYRLPSNMQALLDATFGPGALLFGGGWGDWMHIEIHMSPTEVATWITNNKPVEADMTVDELDAYFQSDRGKKTLTDVVWGYPLPTDDGGLGKQKRGAGRIVSELYLKAFGKKTAT